jgi:tetratricopeptide (TPR) repeat protein
MTQPADPREQAAQQANEHLQRAQAAQKQGSLPEAAAQLMIAADCFSRAGAPDKQAMILASAGDVWLRIGRPTEAMARFQEALPLAQAHGKPQHVAAIMSNIAVIHLEQGKEDVGKPMLEQAITLFRDSGDGVGLGSQLGNLGMFHLRRGEHAVARDYFTQAAEHFVNSGFAQGAAGILRMLGDLERREGQGDAARDQFEKALVLSRQAQDVAGEAASRRSLAQMHLADGNPHIALGHIEQSLTLHREAKDKAGECAALLDLGQAQCLIGQGEAGEASLQAALKLAQAIQAPDGQAAAWAALASRFSQTGNFANAEAALQQAASLYVQLREPFGLAAARINLAQIQIQRGQWPGALENLRSLPSMLPPQLLPSLQPSILAMEGQIAQLQGRLLDALKLMSDAAKGFEAAGRGRLWRSAQVALAFLRIRLQQTNGLSEDLSALIANAASHNDPSAEADARLALAEYLRTQRRHDDAIAMLTQSAALLQKTGQRSSLAAVLTAHAETLLHQHPWHLPTPPNALSQIDALLDQANDIANAVGVPSRKVLIRVYQADLRRRQARLDDAASLLDQAITTSQNLHFPTGLGLALQQRARLAWSLNDNDSRLTALNQAREVFTQMAALLDTQDLLEDAAIPLQPALN